MRKTIEAVFDGAVLSPKDPVSLKPNTRVRIMIEPVEQAKGESASFLHTAQYLQLDGPPDWATNIGA